MNLVNIFKGWFSPATPTLTREQVQGALPVRNSAVTWEEQENGEIVLGLPRRQDRTGKLLSWALSVPETRPLVLDEVGSFVWQLCDGSHSMADIADQLCRQYKLTRREVELSLQQYIQMLSKRGLVAVAVPEHIVEQLDEATRRALGISDRPSGSERQPTADDEDEKPAEADQDS